MCDIESYIYMPLLEEMDYMPTRRYASGHELRTYVNSICTKYGLHERGMFQSSGKSVEWDSSNNEWRVKIVKAPKGSQSSEHFIRADFVLFATGKKIDRDASFIYADRIGRRSQQCQVSRCRWT
jgi:cation diffusion facilitator CzcD-associated flavoprotein CzcO